jgi:hypothetical protein
MFLTTRVKLFVAESPITPLPDVKISLFDKDTYDEDDLLATETTDTGGEVFFGFDSERYTDIEDQPEWKIDSMPELYVVVYDSQDQVVLSTRDQALQDKLMRLIEVPISQELISQHGLMG